MKKANEKNKQGESRSSQRKSYQSPKLSNFGTVAQLTLSTMNNAVDDSGMNMMSS